MYRVALRSPGERYTFAEGASVDRVNILNESVKGFKYTHLSGALNVQL